MLFYIVNSDPENTEFPMHVCISFISKVSDLNKGYFKLKYGNCNNALNIFIMGEAVYSEM